MPLAHVVLLFDVSIPFHPLYVNAVFGVYPWVQREIYAEPQNFCLFFASTYTTYAKQIIEKARFRAEILAEISALPPSVQGTISSYRNVRKNGTAAVYHNLQYTHKGKNHLFAIPTDKVSGFKTAIAAGKKLRDLVFKLSLANANAIASSDSRYKKRAHLVLREPQEYTPSSTPRGTSPRSTRSGFPPTPCGRSSGCTTIPSATSRRTKATRRKTPGARYRSSASWPTERASRCGRNASREPKARTGARRRARSRPPRSSGRRPPPTTSRTATSERRATSRRHTARRNSGNSSARSSTGVSVRFRRRRPTSPTEASGCRPSGVQVLPVQPRPHEIRRVPGKRMVHRLGRHRERIPDDHGDAPSQQFPVKTRGRRRRATSARCLTVATGVGDASVILKRGKNLVT